jgi:hypothetical protein
VRHLRTIGICLGVALALAAISTSGATAHGLEWGQCYAKEGGKYTNSNCTTKGRQGSYEWRKADEIPLVERELSSDLNNPTALTFEADVTTCEPAEGVLQRSCAAGETESHESITVECPGQEYTEPVVAPSGKAVEHWALELTGCSTMGGTAECSNIGAAGGRILTQAMKGKLGYIDRETNETGLTMEPEIKGADFARFTCGDVFSLAIGGANAKEGPAYAPKGGGGAVIAQIGPLDEMVGNLGWTLTYAVNEQLENVPTNLENKQAKAFEAYEFNAEEPTKGSKWSKAGISGTLTLSPEATHREGEEYESLEIRG